MSRRLIRLLPTALSMVSAPRQVRKFNSSTVNVHNVDERGMTPLMYAAFHGKPSDVSNLIARKAAVNAVNMRGVSSLMFASAFNPDAVPQLLESKANVRAKDNNNVTALMYAAANNQIYAMQNLLKYGAAINDIDISGITALMYAAQNGRVEAIEFLLKNKANPEIKDRCGFNFFDHLALRIISRKDNDHFAELLKFFPGPDQMERLKQSISKVMLQLLSSDKNAGIHSDVNLPLIFFEALEQMDFAKNNTQKFLQEILGTLAKPQKKFGDDLVIVESAITGHTSYFAVESVDGKPKFLYYIDGYCPFSADKKSAVGEAVAKFEIDETKFQNSDEVLHSLSEIEDGINFYGLEKVVKSVTPVELLVPVKKQTRGNCTSESLFLTAEFLLGKFHNLDSDASHETCGNMASSLIAYFKKLSSPSVSPKQAHTQITDKSCHL